jgi:hypothetical protein
VLLLLLLLLLVLLVLLLGACWVAAAHLWAVWAAGLQDSCSRLCFDAATAEVRRVRCRKKQTAGDSASDQDSC